jgi:nucleoside 2-deoxyribosyltransferase
MRVYIASPFFNEEEVLRVKKMESFLENRGYTVYSPMRDGTMLSPTSSKDERLKVFNENVDNVFKCDLMVVIVATKDTGTSVELGMKYSQWESERRNIIQIQNDDPDVLNSHDKMILNQETPRIITFSDNGKSVNVMLLGAVLKHCNSWEELEDYMNYVDKIGLGNAKRDYESVGSVPVY